MYLDTNNRWLRFHFIARATLVLQAVTTVALGWLSPTSLTARVLASGGVIGETVLVAMTVVALVALLDMVWWDVLGLKPGGLSTIGAEHMVYLTLGALYWMQAMAGVTTTDGGAWVLLASYMGAGAACCWYGWSAAVRGGRAGQSGRATWSNG